MPQQAGPFAAGSMDRAPRRTTSPAPIDAPRPFWPLVEDRSRNRRLVERVAREEALVQGALWDRHRQIEALLGRPVPPSAMMTGQSADGVGTLTDADYEARLDAMRQEFPNQLSAVESRADLAARLSGEPAVTYYDTPQGAASVRTLSDGSLWLETRDGRSGPVSQFPGARPVRRADPGDVSTSDGSTASGRVRSLSERLASTAEDMAHTNPAMSAFRFLASRGPAYDEFEDPANPGQTIRFASLGQEVIDYERERRDSYRLMAQADAWDSGDASFLHKLARGGATLVGAISGSAADPTSLIAPGRTMGGRIAGSVGINAATDTAAQVADIGAGVETEYRPEQTLIAAAVGGLVQGGFEAGGALSRSASGNPGGVVDALASEIDAGSRQIAGRPLPPAFRAAVARVESDRLDSERLGPVDGGARQEAARAMDAGRSPPLVPPEREVGEIFDTGVLASADLSAEGLQVAEYRGRRILSGSFDPMAIRADSARFQFRRETHAEGITDALADVAAWDQAASGQSILYQDRDGGVFAVDGHQRRGLARRLIQAGRAEDARLDGRLFRAADGWSVDDVRTVAAITNLRESSGTVLDAATLLRETPHLINDRSLPVTGAFMDVARNLARLSPDAFEAVTAGAIPQRLGAVIGELVSDRPDLHLSMIDLLRDAQPRSFGEGRALMFEARRADDASAAGFAATSPQEQIARAQMRAAVLKQLRLDPRLLGRLVMDADAVEAGGHAWARTPGEEQLATDMIAFSVMDRVAVARAEGAIDGLASRVDAVMRGEISLEDASRAIVADMRDAVRVMDEAAADRQARLAPRPPTEASLTALRDFDRPGGRGQAAQTQPKPEDAEAEALAAASWDDLPEVVEEERALTALRGCAPGGG